jgi:hypothetical protein
MPVHDEVIKNDFRLYRHFKMSRYILSLCFIFISIEKGIAELSYHLIDLEDNRKAILISGEFENENDFSYFIELVADHKVDFITFESQGGNIVAAIKLGRIIRLLQLDTVQLKRLYCASACALAFLGGVQRVAESGSIGFHQSSFENSTQLTSEQMVSTVQTINGLIID